MEGNHSAYLVSLQMCILEHVCLTSPFGVDEDKARLCQKGELGRFPVKGESLMNCPTLAGILQEPTAARCIGD